MTTIERRVAALVCTLRHPVSINRTYRMGNGNFHKSKPAKSWSDDAILDLRAAGFKRLPAGDYSISIACTLYTRSHDLDAGVKATIDIIAEALGVNDVCVAYFSIEKVVVETSVEQRLCVNVIVNSIEEREGAA